MRYQSSLQIRDQVVDPDEVVGETVNGSGEAVGGPVLDLERYGVELNLGL